jgi:hypothetical protein
MQQVRQARQHIVTAGPSCPLLQSNRVKTIENVCDVSPSERMMFLVCEFLFKQQFAREETDDTVGTM